MSTQVKDKAVTVEDLTEALKRVNIPLPSVTSSDEGKVLTVSSTGEWVADTLPLYTGTVVSGNG